MTRARLNRLVAARIATTALVFVAAAAVVNASPARAGTYDVVACDAAPGSANNSWRPLTNDAQMAAYAACPSGGDRRRGLVARNAVGGGGASVGPGAVAQYAFFAPAGTAIVGLLASYRFYHAASNWEGALSDGTQVIRGCPAGTGACDVSSAGEWIPLSGQGVIYIDAYCAYGSCPTSSTGDAGHDYLQATANLYSATVRLEDDSAPGIANARGGLWSDGWHSGGQDYAFDSSDNAGVRETRVLIDGNVVTRSTKGCDFTLTIPCPTGDTAGTVDTRTVRPDGSHSVVIQSEDAAGNVAQIGRQASIDNTPPGPPQQLQVDGGDGWRNTNTFTLRWQNPAQTNTAPIAGANYELCPTRGTAADCKPGKTDGANITSIAGLKVPATGDWQVRLWLRDAAGNADRSTAGDVLHLRFDDQAPDSAAFTSPDPADPTKIAVLASDPGSGIAGGAIEYKKQRATAWHGMATQVDGNSLVAHVDDEHLSNGTYELRARVDDAAGNERSTSSTTSGDPATVTLPLRLPTHLVAGRARHRHHRTRYRTRLHVRFHHRIRLHGRLTNGAGVPFAATQIEVFQRVHVAGAGWTPAGELQTSKTGRFSYLAPAGVSRTLRFRYGGTATIRAAHRDVVLKVGALTTFHVSRHSVINGETVRMHGRLRGGHVPDGGKLIALQVFLRGGWHTFATTRSHAHGRWHYDYRFDGTRGRQTYRFRAMVPHEATYPYATGVSNRARVVVRGL
jgi:hypothetical protein